MKEAHIVKFYAKTRNCCCWHGESKSLAEARATHLKKHFGAVDFDYNTMYNRRGARSGHRKTAEGEKHDWSFGLS